MTTKFEQTARENCPWSKRLDHAGGGMCGECIDVAALLAKADAEARADEHQKLFYVRQEYTDRWDVWVKWPLSEAPSVYGQSRPIASYSSKEKAEAAIRALKEPTNG